MHHNIPMFQSSITMDDPAQKNTGRTTLARACFLLSENSRIQEGRIFYFTDCAYGRVVHNRRKNKAEQCTLKKRKFVRLE